MKKKLLFTQFGRQWNTLVTKFLRLNRRIKSSAFREIYSEQQQNYLLKKLQNLYKKLEKMQYHVGFKLAGTALALLLASSVSYGQLGFAPQKYVAIGQDNSKDRNGGDFSGTMPFWDPGPGWTMVRPAFVDLDKDGDQDMFTGVKGYINYYKNDGTGHFPDAPVKLQADGADIAPDNYMVPDFADIDKDGDMDLYVGTGAGFIEIYLNDGSGAFTHAGRIAIEGYDVKVDGGYAVPSFVDLDKDGSLDLYVSSNTKVIVVHNNGDGTWSDGGTFKVDGVDLDNVKVDGKYFALAFADQDHDGNLEAYLGIGGDGKDLNGQIIEYQNDGHGVFTTAGLLEVDSAGVSIGALDVHLYSQPSFADLDNDGFAELYSGAYSGGQILEKYDLLVKTPYNSVASNAARHISVYPNPASDFIRFSGLKDVADVRIYNVTGTLKAIYTKVSGNIDVSSLAKGMYFITVNDGKANYTQKLIKK